MSQEWLFDTVYQSISCFWCFTSCRNSICLACKYHSIAFVESFSRFYQALPSVSFYAFDQQKLYMGACTFLEAVHSCWNDSGIIKYKAIAGVYIIKYIVKMTVFNRLFTSVENHKPASVSLFERRLGYEFFRKIIIKIVKSHYSISIRSCSVSGSL